MTKITLPAPILTGDFDQVFEPNMVNQRRIVSKAAPFQGMVPLEDELHRKKMIGMRMHLKDGETYGVDHLSTAVGSTKVFVFVVQDDKPVMLEDSVELFPSDTLITQLRLLSK